MEDGKFKVGYSYFMDRGAILGLIIFLVSLSGVEAQVSVRFGKKEKVFDWSSQKCIDIDLPDAPARAYVDADGKVKMSWAEDIFYQSMGDNIGSVSRSCSPAFKSVGDVRPRMYQDHEWVVAPYTLDGTTVYSLVHNEYHGWEGGRLGCNSSDVMNCWWNSVNMAISRDKGLTFNHILQAPDHVVLSSPNEYSANNKLGPVGWFEPSNIIKRGEYYYFLVRSHHPPDSWINTVARSNNLADPKSWRLWDGVDFSRMGDRSRATPIGPAENFYLGYNEYLGEYISVNCHWGAPQRGIYYSLTNDNNLTSWGNSVYAGGEPYMYCSLLQPGDDTRNFEKPGRSPWVYYTACGSGNNVVACGGLDRDLWRVRVRFDKAGEENKYELLDLRMSEWTGIKTLDASFFVNDANLRGNNIGFVKENGLSFMRFGGANNWLDVPSSPSLDIRGDVTLETKIRLNSITSDYFPALFLKEDNLKRQYGLFLIPGTGQLHFSIGKIGGGFVGTVGNKSLVDGQWHEIKVVFRNSESKAYYMIDGRLDAIGDYNGAKIGDVLSSANLIVGSGINGDMDYARILNYAASVEVKGDESISPTTEPTPPPSCGKVLEKCCISEPKCETGLECSGGNMCLKAPSPTVGGVKIIGDANGDGVVNLTDQAIWKKEFVEQVGLSADFDNNGKVDMADLAIWKTENEK